VLADPAAQEFAALLAGVEPSKIAPDPEGGFRVYPSGARVLVPEEELAAFRVRPFLPAANAMVAAAAEADASAYRALSALGRTFGWGRVAQAWIVREGEPLPEPLRPWAAFIAASFERYAAPLYLLVSFNRRASPLLVTLRRQG